jgi:hypothetical protein
MLDETCSPSLNPRLVRRNDGRLRVSAVSLEIWASAQEARSAGGYPGSQRGPPASSCTTGNEL